jgi:hypothetical protein
MQRKAESVRSEATVARKTQRLTLGMVLDAQAAQVIHLKQRVRKLEKRVTELEQRVLASKRGK